MSNALPPPIDDPIFGRLEWDDEELLLGKIEYEPGRLVAVLIITDYEEFATIDVVGNARVALERFRRDERRYRLLSAKELNADPWCDEILADEDVANLLLIATFEFRGGGRRLEVYWNDSELLKGGHVVYTEIGPDGEFVYAGML